MASKKKDSAGKSTPPWARPVVKPPQGPAPPPAELAAAYNRAVDLRRSLDVAIAAFEAGAPAEELKKIATWIDRLWFAQGDADRRRLTALLHAAKTGALLLEKQGIDSAVSEAVALLRVFHPDMADRIDRAILRQTIEAWNTTKPRKGEMSRRVALAALARSAGLIAPKASTLNEYVSDHVASLKKRGAL